MKKQMLRSRSRVLRIILCLLFFLNLSAKAQNFQIIWTMDGHLGGSSSSPNFSPSNASLTGAHPHSLPSILYYALGGGDFAYGTTYWHATGPEKYLSFSFSVNTFEYALTSVSYRIRRSDSGPTDTRLRSSLDGFAADISSYHLNADATFYTVTVPMGLTNQKSGITFRLYNDNASSYQGAFYFDQIIINGTISSFLLPVDLAYFRVKTEGKAVQVTWETASESNSKEFVVERSQDLNTFERIGTLAGAGESAERLQYLFVDENPVPGINYYRIRMVDKDGKLNFSKTADAIINSGTATFTVSPNPADATQIRIRTNIPYPEQLSLTDISGRDVAIGTVISQGNFMDLFPNQTLSSGLYVLSLKVNGKWQREKVVVP